MKANELMIGDWVRLQYKHFITEELVTKDFRVTEIQKGIETHYIWSKSGNMGVVEHIQPISLTKEILVKNGFNLTDVEEFARLEFADGKFVMRAMYDKDSGKQKGWGYFAFNVLSIVDYVHELQHALRLCGIDKEIVL